MRVLFGHAVSVSDRHQRFATRGAARTALYFRPFRAGDSGWGNIAFISFEPAFECICQPDEQAFTSCMLLDVRVVSSQCLSNLPMIKLLRRRAFSSCMPLNIHAVSLLHSSNLSMIELPSPVNLIADNAVMRAAGVAPVSNGWR
nr:MULTISPECIES: hypothetical protein [unclassified Burkholderia]